MEIFRAGITVELGATDPDGAENQLALITRALDVVEGVRVIGAEIEVDSEP